MKNAVHFGAGNMDVVLLVIFFQRIMLPLPLLMLTNA